LKHHGGLHKVQRLVVLGAPDEHGAFKPESGT
jgi:hypothetical protein